MEDISSEAKNAHLQEPEKPVDAMTEEEAALFRKTFDADMMGFDGREGIDAKEDEDGN